MSSDPKDAGFGRTGWDVLMAGRVYLAAALALALSAAGLYLAGRYLDVDAAMDMASSFWPALLSPAAGWYMAKLTVESLYRPQGRYVVLMDPGEHLFRAVFIPEAVFRTMSQTGNNVVYHTVGGSPLYVAKGMDMSEGRIDYGWIHELDALQVMTRESAWLRWDETLNSVLEENLELMSHPHIIGLGHARRSLRSHLDGLGALMGFTEPDYSKHTEAGDDEQGD